MWFALTIAVQLQGVAPLPGCMAGASESQVELVALAQTSALLACRCQATHLSVLVHRLCDPLGVWVASDGLVEWVDQNHLKEFVGRVLAYPVGVENSQGSAVTASTLLSNGLQAAGKFDLVNTMVHWLAIGGTLGHRAFTSTTAHTDTVDYIALLGLVSQPTGLVRSGGSRSTVKVGQLTILPAADAEEEAHHIGLLLAP